MTIPQLTPNFMVESMYTVIENNTKVHIFTSPFNTVLEISAITEEKKIKVLRIRNEE